MLETAGEPRRAAWLRRVWEAALIQTNVKVQLLTVEAALTGRRGLVYHAAMFDPHTGTELDLDQIHALLDEPLDAHRAWLPAW